MGLFFDALGSRRERPSAARIRIKTNTYLPHQAPNIDPCATPIDRDKKMCTLIGTNGTCVRFLRSSPGSWFQSAFFWGAATGGRNRPAFPQFTP
jgi:hypothetical protein